MLRVKRWSALGRTTISIVATVFFCAALSGQASAELPSIKIGRGDLVSLAAADTYYGTDPTHSPGHGFGRPVEIKALARALDYDPDLIYSYVKNKIEITPLFGLQKGALGAHLDKHGTAFDQAHLMAELAKEAMAQAGSSITAVKIVYGDISLDGAQFDDWLGITDAKAACILLAYGGIPATVNGASSCSSLTGSVTSVVMKHAWVQLTISGAGAGTYDYDPAYKKHQHFAGISLATEMGYSRAAFSAAARGGMASGKTTGVDYVKDISPSGISSQLLSYSNTLLNNLKTTHKDKTLNEIVGGSVILDEDVPTGGASGAAFPYTLTAQLVADDVPDQFRTVLGVWFSGDALIDTTHDPVDAEFYVDEIYGRKIELVPGDASNGVDQIALWDYPQNIPWTLRLLVDEVLVKEKDGVTDAIHNPGLSSEPLTGYVSAPNRTGYKVRLDVNHPYAANSGTYMDRLAASQVEVATTVSIVSGWGVTGPEMMAKLAREFGQDTEMTPSIPLGPEIPEDLATGSLQENTKAKIGAAWLAQYSRMAEMLASIGNGIPLTHHTVGVVFADTLIDEDCDWVILNECRYFVGDQVMRMDLHSGLSAVHLNNSDAGEEAILQGIAAAAATLEGSVFEQQMDTVDNASTAERFQWAEENLTTAKYYHYKTNHQGKVGPLTLQEGYEEDDPNKPFYLTGYGVFGGATITAYLNDGYEVFAVNDEFLGPGYHLGPFHAAYSGAGGPGGFVNDSSRQRGTAYIAVKRDAGGKVIDIAHIVTGTDGAFKGGGGAAGNDNKDEFDPAKAADILKDEFQDRSVLHGVDLASGGTSWSSGTLLSTGIGGFPYALDFSFSYVNNNEEPNNVAQRHWDGGGQNNHQSSAAISGSGLEAMGASHPWNAVGSIVAFYVAVDMATEGTDLDNIILLPFIDHWWRQQLSYNIISLSGLGGGSQFVRLPDGSFNAPVGSGATLIQTGQRQAVRAGETTQTPSLFRRWVYDQIDLTATMKDGSQLFFDAVSHKTDDKLNALDSYRHMLTRYTAPSGFEVNYAYDVGTRDRGIRLNTVTNDLGRWLVFGYASATSATLTGVSSAGRTATLGAGITDAAGKTYILSVATGGQIPVDARPTIGPYLGGVYLPTDPVNLAFEYSYDETMTAISVKDAEAVLGNRAAYEFHVVPGFRGERVDPLGNSYSAWYGKHDLSGAYSFGTFVDELDREVRTEFDAWGRVTARQYPEGDRREFDYDLASNVTALRKISKDGSTILSASATYHATWNKPTSITDFLGNIVDIVYGATGGATGQITSAQRPSVYNPATGTNQRPTYSFAYNADGQPLQVTDADGMVTLNSYFPVGHAMAPGLLESTTVDSAGLALTTWFAYDSAGNPTHVTDPRGTAPVFVPFEPAECLLWDNEPVPPVCLVWGNAVPAHWTADPDYTTRTVFDAMRRPTRVTDALGNYSDTIYDALGRKIRIKSYDQPGTLLQASYKTYTPTGQEDLGYNPYDPADCSDPDDPLTCTPFGGVTDRDYDDLDRLLEVMDPEGRITRSVYDVAGQLEKIIRAYGTPLQQDYQTYDYSLNGQQLWVEDANGNRTDYFFDGFDRLIKTQFPAIASGAGASNPSDFETYAYDLGGNLMVARTRDGEYIKSAYDPLGRVLRKVVHEANATALASNLPGPACGAGAGEVCYQYDLSGRQTRVRFADNSYDIDYLFDTAGRLASVTDDGRLISYAYDAASNRTEVHYPGADNFWVEYFHDELNRVVAVTERGTDPMVGFLATYNYDPLSRRTLLTYGNGRTTSYAFEPDSALDILDHRDTGGLTTASWTFDYNLANQVISKDVSDVAMIYGYGADKNETYTTNGLNQYPSIIQDGTNYTLTYDGNGSLLGDGTWAYAYDVENRLVSASGPGVAATYVYDPLGRRAAKSGTGVAPEVYLSDGVEEIADYDGAGSLLRRYVHGPGIDEPLLMTVHDGAGAETGRQYYHADHLGSVVAMSDAVGAIADIYTYSAWGEVADPSGNPFRFTGRRLDAETGLYYYRARYYSSAIGRFLQTDPVGYGDNMNMYAYVGNDPINGKDPSGKAAALLFRGAFAIGAAAGRAAGTACVKSAACRKAVVKGAKEILSVVKSIVSIFDAAEVQAPAPANNNEEPADKPRGTDTDFGPDGTKEHRGNVDPNEGLDRGGLNLDPKTEVPGGPGPDAKLVVKVIATTAVASAVAKALVDGVKLPANDNGETRIENRVEDK